MKDCLFSRLPIMLLCLAMIVSFTMPHSLLAGAGGIEGGSDASPFKGVSPNTRRQVNITLDNMDIYPVLDHILGDMLQLSYVVDPAIKGTISVRIKGNYTKNELLNLFNSILQIHGLAITSGDNGLYKVVRKANSAKAGTQVGKAGRRAIRPGDVIQAFQLTYISAQTTSVSIRTFLSPGALVVPVISTNSLIIVDTQENLRKAAKILNLMDADCFKDIQWKLFSLEHIDAADLHKDLEKIFKSQGIYNRPGLDQGGLELIPLKTMNAILVLTRWPKILDTIEFWIKEFDQGQSEKGAKVNVYFVQNGSAKEIADILKQLYGGKKSTKSSKRVLVKRLKKTKEAVTGELTGEVEIIPDEINNAIVIKATPKDYEIISSVLKRIDIVPRQVLIDVLIFEVTLNKNLEYGVEWLFKQKKIGHHGSYHSNIVLEGAKNTADNAGLGNFPKGFSFSLFDSAGGLRALMSALAEDTNINVLSAPNILAVDNHESTIEVGEDVPTKTGTTTTSGGNVTENIQYRKTGILLKVKPRINDSGLVRLDVTQEVSQRSKNTVQGISSPIFSTRKATTSLVAKDGQTIVLGGLIKNKRDKTKSGFPLLKDIPGVGNLFSTTEITNEKTELLFVITPHVIQTRAEADFLTREFAEKVKGLKEQLKLRKEFSRRKDVIRQKALGTSMSLDEIEAQQKQDSEETKEEETRDEKQQGSPEDDDWWTEGVETYED